MTQKDPFAAPSTASSNTLSLTSSSGGVPACTAVPDESMKREVKAQDPPGTAGDDLPMEQFAKRAILTTVRCSTPTRCTKAGEGKWAEVKARMKSRSRSPDSDKPPRRAKSLGPMSAPRGRTPPSAISDSGTKGPKVPTPPGTRHQGHRRDVQRTCRIYLHFLT